MSTSYSIPVPETRLSFRWRSSNAKECYLAICEAVRLGYDTREALLAVLPQFSVNRLVLALDALIAAGMAQVDCGCLSVSKDMQIVETLASGQMLELPIEVDAFERDRTLIQEILAHLGLENPTGAMLLLGYTIEDAKNAG